MRKRMLLMLAVVVLFIGAIGSFKFLQIRAAIAERVRSLAARHELDLRAIDRALWAWDKLSAR